MQNRAASHASGSRLRVAPRRPGKGRWYSLARRGVRVVDGAALEKRCAKAPWVRIPPSPPGADLAGASSLRSQLRCLAQGRLRPLAPVLAAALACPHPLGQRVPRSEPFRIPTPAAPAAALVPCA